MTYTNNTVRLTIYAGVWALCLSAICLIIACTVRESVFVFGDNVKRVVNSFVPEGWSFFTRSPREEMADIYQITNHGLEKISMQCSSPRNLLGVSRKSRKIGMEISVVAARLQDSLWIKNKHVTDIAKPTSLKINEVHIDADMAYLKKGDYVIEAFLPIPWAWSKSTRTQTQSRIIRVRLI